MRGLFLALGYILGNKDARDKCIHMLKQTSCVIDETIKNTELGKLVDEAWRNSGLFGGDKPVSKPETDKQLSTSAKDNRGQSPSGARDID